MKNKFIKSTIILVIGGIITKLLSFIIRIYFTRVIKDGINIYSLIMPTYSLLITITQLGFPIAISNIIAKGEKRGKNIMSSIVPVSLLLNLILILIVIFSAKYLSNNLLREPDTYYPLIALSLVLPFISLSSIIRGYFFGKQQMMPHSISNIIEQLFKLFIVLVILPHLLKYGTIVAVCGYILISILSESISIVVFLLYLPKNFKIERKDIKPDFGTIKDVLAIGLPAVGSRIIGNIGYFFEPIILSYMLLKTGFTNDYIISNYAIYNTYVIGLLIVPTFLLGAIGTSMLPEISKNINNKEKVRRLLKKTMIFSLIIGVFSNIVLYFSCDFILNLLFDTTDGCNYIRFLAPFFIMFYFESPLTSILQAYNMTGYIMKTTIIGVIIKLVSLTLLSLFHIGIYALILSEVINIFYVVSGNYIKVKQILK
jgi:stage V sporulation protein B